MVLLTMTSAIVAAVKEYEASRQHSDEAPSTEPDLSTPEVGKPISHGQIIDISKHLKSIAARTPDAQHTPYHLNDLLQGSQIYVAPPRPKAEPTTEYKQLMARLRREEEARSYERMIASTIPSSNPFKQTPASQAGPAFYSPNAPLDDPDEITFSDVNRQLTLIINVLVSIIACGIGIWLVAWHWAAPARLALSMGGGGVVGVAEVVIYAGYLRRLQTAKDKERSKKERKTITATWVTESKDKKYIVPIDSVSGGTGIDSAGSTTYRKGRKRG